MSGGIPTGEPGAQSTASQRSIHAALDEANAAPLADRSRLPTFRAAAAYLFGALALLLGLALAGGIAYSVLAAAPAQDGVPIPLLVAAGGFVVAGVQILIVARRLGRGA